MDKTSGKDRINEIIEVIMKVAKGDYSTQIELSDKNDELDSLAIGLNMMIDDIKSGIEKDKKRVIEVEKANQDLQRAHEASLSIMEDLNRQGTELNALNKQLQEEIAERKQTEEVLRRAKEFNEIVLNSMKDSICIIDVRDYRIIDVNEAFLNILGLKKEDVIGKTCYEVTHNRNSPCRPPDNTCPLLESLKTGKHSSADHMHYSKDGRRLYVEVSTSPIKNETREVLQIVHVVKDITGRKQAEEKLKQTMNDLACSNTELQQFAYVASHDLQEPLRMVSSYVQLLGRRYKGKLDEDADEFIAYAVDGATRMQQLINDLLTYSRVGTRAKPFEPTDTESVLKNATDNLKVAIEESGAVITHDSLPTVMADSSQLLQLFQNLVGNGIKFRNGGAPQIKVSAAEKENEWLFSVSDNGIGIDPKHKYQVFQIFQRLHSRNDYPGTGIGLAVSKKIVERHGGRIWVESEPGKGSTFYFTIPNNGGVPL